MARAQHQEKSLLRISLSKVLAIKNDRAEGEEKERDEIIVKCCVWIHLVGGLWTLRALTIVRGASESRRAQPEPIDFWPGECPPTRR